MGNYISNNYIYLFAKRTLGRYNTQNRVFKELKRQETKPVVAPKFDSKQIDYGQLLQDDSEYLKKTMKKNPALDDRLKEVYVTSMDRKIEPPPREEETSTERTLPLDRYTEEFEYGFKESKVIPRGKVSLAQALKFITDHHSNPTEWTIEKIAKQYKMKDYVADDIIKHFKSYELYVPGKTGKTLITGPIPMQIEADSKTKGK